MLAGVGAAMYPPFASWLSLTEQVRVLGLAGKQVRQDASGGEVEREHQLALAREYNLRLRSAATPEEQRAITVSDGADPAAQVSYSQLLMVNSSGIMGRLQYVSRGIDLPVYHGTADATLARGIGHLEGTSLPVGGVGSRAVLTGHRGLPQAPMLDNLGEAQVGDDFMVTIAGEVLAYRVVDVAIVTPEETARILPESNRDLVTLVTCTPLGINSHRILVTGERVLPTPGTALRVAATAPQPPGFPWWVMGWPALFLGLALYAWRSGFPVAS